MRKLFLSARPCKLPGAVHDAFAGITLAAMNIPQALGYTKIAGMPVVTGLYSLLLPAVAFAALGSSRFLVVSADSATAAIFASGAADLASPAGAQYVAIAGTVALFTAGLLLIARLLKLGFIADFLSQTVLVGFLTGVGFQVGIAVLGEMLGLQITSRRTVLQLGQVIRKLPQLHLPTLAVSAVVVLVLLLLQRFLPRLPGALIAVAGAIAASAMWNFSGQGIAVIGSVAGGLPHLGKFTMHWRELPKLLSVAASCSIMIITQSAATARIYASRHLQHLDENEDLAGLAAANALAGLSGTFVVNGSPTQTAMVESAGAQSQLAQLTTSVVVALVLLFLTRPLEYLPRCVLGALVFIIAIRLIKVRTLWKIRLESPGEFGLAATTAVVVVVAGVEQGILLAMILSLLRIVHHSYRPHTGVMVLNQAGLWDLKPAAPGAVTEPGLVIYQFGAELFYANANHFAEEVKTILGMPPSPIRWLIVDAEAIIHVDYSAARVILELNDEIQRGGTKLGFARIHIGLKSDLERHQLSEVIGPDMIFDRLHGALDAYRALPSAAAVTSETATERNG
ncbi:MAG: SulP family inorganic anion transporter [Acidobacteriaceae bacterium]